MRFSMFFVQIAGRLGKDPEKRFTTSGQQVTSFNMAVNQRKGKEEVTVWVRITIWGDKFDKMITYLKKGSGIIVLGRMMPPSSYVDKEGKTQFSLEVTAEAIEFSPFGKTDQDGQQGQSASPSAASYAAQSAAPAHGQGAPSRANQELADEESLPF